MSSTPDRKKQRHRSPAYPSVDLPTAIEKAAVIYQAEKRGRAPVSAVMEHCGYDQSSSGGMRLIAALKQYGLLVDEGNNEDRMVRISNAGLDILLDESEDSPQRVQAIRTAALAPTIHRKIWDHFDGTLPSKATLRVFLIRQMDFNDSHVDRFIRQFFNTINFARLDEPDIINEVDDDLDDDSADAPATPAPSPRSGQNVILTPPPTDFLRLPITLPTLKVAWLEVPRQMNESEYITLVNTLTTFKSALVPTPETKPNE
jgi:hypothetical protein